MWSLFSYSIAAVHSEGYLSQVKNKITAEICAPAPGSVCGQACSGIERYVHRSLLLGARALFLFFSSDLEIEEEEGIEPGLRPDVCFLFCRALLALSSLALAPPKKKWYSGDYISGLCSCRRYLLLPEA